MRRLLLLATLLACNLEEVETGDERGAMDCPSSVNPIGNPGFESGTLPPWKRSGKVAIVPRHHGGAKSARVGSANTYTGTSKVSQSFAVPAGLSTLSVWVWPACSDSSGDTQKVELRSASGPLLATLFSGCSNTRAWTLLQQDTTAWAGQSVKLVVTAVDDGDLSTYLNIDDAVVDSIAPPTVGFTTPAEQASVASRADLPITVEATTSPCASLAQLDLFELFDGIEWPMASSTSSPLSATAPGTYPAGGPRTYLARATDTAGNVSTATLHIVRSDDTWSRGTGTSPATDPAIASIEMSFGFGTRIAEIDRFTGTLEFVPAISLGTTVNPPAYAGDLLFATGHNARLYRVDGPAGTVAIDLGRGLGCVPDDTLRAAPSAKNGLVFVPTYHACGDHSMNQVIALDQETLGEAWRFNRFGEYQVDAFSSACAVDPDADRIYCGARSFPMQSTLFAIEASTGALVWSADAGSLETTPALDAARRVLYVGDTGGVLHAFHPDTGAPLGSLALTSCASGGPCGLGTPVVGSGPAAQAVFVTDAEGALHAVFDDPTGMFELWSSDNAPFVVLRGRPALDLAAGKLYIGDSTGRLHQLALASGTLEWFIEVVPAGGPVGSPILVDENSDGTLDHVLVVADGSGGGAGAARKVPVPLL